MHSKTNPFENRIRRCRTAPQELSQDGGSERFLWIERTIAGLKIPTSASLKPAPRASRPMLN